MPSPGRVGRTYYRSQHRLHLDPVFFFQAEDGIRDVAVTGVQTCALPILTGASDKWWRWCEQAVRPGVKLVVKLVRPLMVGTRMCRLLRNRTMVALVRTGG